MVRPSISESKVAARLEQSLQPGMNYENGDDNSSSERIDGKQFYKLQSTNIFQKLFVLSFYSFFK